MNNTELAHSIEAAKDKFGVITEHSIDSHLLNLSASDWKQASQVFDKGHAKLNGLWIEDKGSSIAIHNDMTKAEAAAKGKVTNDAFGFVEETGPSVAFLGATTGLVGAFAGASEGSLAAALTFGALGAGLTAGIPLAVLAVAGVAGGAIYVHDRIVARKDVAESANVSFHPKLSDS